MLQVDRTSGENGHLNLEVGSFRDRHGRVFYHQGNVYRYLSPQALTHWHQLSKTRFFSEGAAAGRIVNTEQVKDDTDTLLGLDSKNVWAGVLRHEKIPFVSYPYEWSWGMLRQAALLQLDLLEGALNEEMILKDATAFNVQWRGASPVFIDTPSFESLQPGESWVGYQQFCQHFLYPLMLQAYKHVGFHDWLRGNIEGIGIQEMANLMSLRDQLRPGVFPYVTLQGKLQQKYSDTNQNLKAHLKDAGFSKQLIQNNVRRLRKIISGMSWGPPQSEWSDYVQTHNYSEENFEQKKAFVHSAVAQQRWPRVWDLGCNTGTFSQMASKNADYVVAMDFDHLAIERLYQQLQSENNKVILPLVMNIAQPSPSLGWQGQERKGLVERGKPSLVLCLALIHHLVISANIPVREFIDWLASLNSHVVIEFVSKDDPMVRKLLQNKVDQYDDYEIGYFEACLEESFQVIERQPLDCQTRTMYFLQPR